LFLDENGNVLPGFDWRKTRDKPVDGLRMEMRWVDGSAVRAVGEAGHKKPLRLRWMIRNGDLFAFQVL
jgi:hypothetical protein